MKYLLILFLFSVFYSCSPPHGVCNEELKFPVFTVPTEFLPVTKITLSEEFDPHLLLIRKYFESTDRETRFDALRRLCDFTKTFDIAKIIIDTATFGDTLFQKEALKCIQRNTGVFKEHILEALRTFPDNKHIPYFLTIPREPDEDYFNFILNDAFKNPGMVILLSAFFKKYSACFFNINSIIDYIIKNIKTVSPDNMNSIIEHVLGCLEGKFSNLNEKIDLPKINNIDKFIIVLENFLQRNPDKKITTTILNIVLSYGKPIPVWLKKSLKTLKAEKIIYNLKGKPNKNDKAFLRKLVGPKLEYILYTSKDYNYAHKVAEIIDYKSARFMDYKNDYFPALRCSRKKRDTEPRFWIKDFGKRLTFQEAKNEITKHHIACFKFKDKKNEKRDILRLLKESTVFVNEIHYCNAVVLNEDVDYRDLGFMVRVLKYIPKSRYCPNTAFDWLISIHNQLDESTIIKLYNSLSVTEYRSVIEDIISRNKELFHYRAIFRPALFRFRGKSLFDVLKNLLPEDVMTSTSFDSEDLITPLEIKDLPAFLTRISSDQYPPTREIVLRALLLDKNSFVSLDKPIKKMLLSETNADNLFLLMDLAEKYKIPQETIEKKLLSFLDLKPDPECAPVYLTLSLEKNQKIRAKYAEYLKKWIKVGRKETEFDIYVDFLPDKEDGELAGDISKYLSRLVDKDVVSKTTALLLSKKIFNQKEKSKLISDLNIQIFHANYSNQFLQSMFEFISKDPTENLKLFKVPLRGCFITSADPITLKDKIKLPSDLKNFSYTELRLLASLLAVADNPDEKMVIKLLEAKPGIIRSETLRSLLKHEKLAKSMMKKLENIHKNDPLQSVRHSALEVLRKIAPNKYKEN